MKSLVPSQLGEKLYLGKFSSFGVDEENVRGFIIDLLKWCGWTNVSKEHDVLATHDKKQMLVECKKYDPSLLYIDQHVGGNSSETAVEQLQRGLKRIGCEYGLLTDGATFRFIYNANKTPELFDCYLVAPEKAMEALILL